MDEMTPAIRERLFALQDEQYRDFQRKLIPTLDPERIIGVRMPQLRALARELRAAPRIDAFMRELPHAFMEEDILHGLFISDIRDYGECVAALHAFLPYVDNWATCDLLSPRAFKKHPPELTGQIERWIASDHVYTVRFGIGMLLHFYLDDAFDERQMALVAGVRSEEYYINMMIAWYFATALAKQRDAAMPYIRERRLSVWTHNKAIQKAIESYRVSDEDKAALRALRIGRKG